MPVLDHDVLSVADYLRKEHLTIPPFQRPYKWSADNVVQLLYDIETFKSKPTYRIGTIVICNENGERKIVDGQQRTITFLLILKALTADVAPLISDSTLKDELLQLGKAAFDPKFNSDESKQHIRENYPEIRRRIQTADYAWIKFFLHSCTVTYFEIDDISEAFQFFDSQNARGRDLEPHDLLKAYHLRENGMSADKRQEAENAQIVADWQSMKTTDLAELFTGFLFRVRGWSSGQSARYFTKRDIQLFKGINLREGKQYRYMDFYRMVVEQLSDDPDRPFPFQLNQVIVNGRYFFEMITHYRRLHQRLNAILTGITAQPAKAIIDQINDYLGMKRAGDGYTRMLFDCAMLTYLDRFGEEQLPAAAEKLFIWAWSIRLRRQNLQLASIDNYVTGEINIFRIITEATAPETILQLRLPALSEEHQSPATAEIRNLFIQLGYART